MHLDAGAVGAEALRVLAARLLLPKRSEQPLENAALGPVEEPGVDCVPFSEALQQRAPLSAVLHDVQNRVDENDVVNPNVSALNRKIGVDSGTMFRRGLFHDCAPLDFNRIVDKHLSTKPGKTQAKILVLTGPSDSFGIDSIPI